MGATFQEIPKELNFIRLTPRLGGWAMLRGFTHKLQPPTIPGFCDRLGLRRMDIFWIHNEQIPSDVMNAWNKRLKRSRRFIDLTKLQPEWEDFEDSYALSAMHDPAQGSIFDAHLGGSETVRFYRGELNILTESRLDELKEAYRVVALSGEDIESGNMSPIIAENTKDMLGSLMLDGLSRADAVGHVIQHAMNVDPEDSEKLESTVSKPHYMYKIRDEYYQCFNRGEEKPRKRKATK